MQKLIVYSIEVAADLNTVEYLMPYQHVMTAGRVTVGDGLGATYIYWPASAAIVDGLTVFAALGGVGRWIKKV